MAHFTELNYPKCALSLRYELYTQRIKEANLIHTYRNNMNDFVLIYFAEDEIYVRPPTVNILHYY